MDFNRKYCPLLKYISPDWYLPELKKPVSGGETEVIRIQEKYLLHHEREWQIWVMARGNAAFITLLCGTKISVWFCCLVNNVGIDKTLRFFIKVNYHFKEILQNGPQKYPGKWHPIFALTKSKNY